MRSRVLLALMIAGLLVAGVAPVAGGTGPAGSVVSWGSDRFGALSGTPSGADYVAVAAGDWHSLALKADGSIVGWGRGYCDVTPPPADTDFVAISAGHDYALALKSDGAIVGWGCNDYGPAE